MQAEVVHADSGQAVLLMGHTGQAEDRRKVQCRLRCTQGTA